MRLLVIEDEPHIRDSLYQFFTDAAHIVEVAIDGDEGWYYLENFPFDAVIVDLGLPKRDGISVIQQARSKGLVLPILILTARGHWVDKVSGLNAGADDYVVKPFQMEEVMARINALVRRSVGLTHSRFTAGEFSLDFNSQIVTLNGSVLDITGFEYKLLEHFVRHPNQVLSKSALVQQLYAQDFERESNTVEVFVGRLRKKIDPLNNLSPIETLRGRGYRFKPESFIERP